MDEIKVKVKTKDVLSISYLNRLQGDLKILTDENYKKLKNEILTEGFCFAIHVWENKEDAKIYILDGTQRLETLTRMKDEGYKIPQIPVVFIEADNINDAKKILLGGASQYGEYNQKGAEDFISTIEGIDIEYLNQNLALSNIIFDQIDFKQKEEKIIDVQGHQRTISTYVEGEDDIPEVVESKVKLGDVFQLGNHRLMCGDSTSIDAVEKLMDWQKADMVFTDHPYGVDYNGINNDDRDGLFSLLDSVFKNYVNSIKKGASIYCFHSDKCADIFHNVFRKYFHFSSMIIWLKPSLVMGQSDYQSKHEPCLYGWEKSGKHTWYSDRKQTSIIKSGREKVEGHTTPKPVDFIEKCLNNSSKSNQSIIDLFGGSGSTLIACEKTNRKCFMMELDPHYCSVIIERWQNFSNKKATRLNNDGSNILYDDIKQTILRPAEL